MARLQVSPKAGLDYRTRFGLWPQQAAGLRVCRHARSTKTLVSIYDGEPANLDTEAGRWQTVCETHGNICSHETFATAVSHLSQPEGWCEDCQARKG